MKNRTILLSTEGKCEKNAARPYSCGMMIDQVVSRLRDKFPQITHQNRGFASSDVGCWSSFEITVNDTLIAIHIDSNIVDDNKAPTEWTQYSDKTVIKTVAAIVELLDPKPFQQIVFEKRVN